MQQRKGFECGNFSVVGPIKGHAGMLGHNRLMCKTYGCKTCRPKKLSRVRSRIAEIASKLKLLRFVTLTLDPKKIRQGVRSETYIRETWRKMRVLLARRFGSTISFIGVLEFQKSGLAHLHLLVGVYIPQDWLSSAWQSVGGGKIVDIRYVDVHRISGYLIRYLTGDKIAHTLSLLPLRGRIFTCSRSISFWGKKGKNGWWLCKKKLETLHASAQKVENERWESLETVNSIDSKLLMYFEAFVNRMAIGEKDAMDVIQALIQARDAVPCR